jgi:hypothetical protein
VHIAKPVRPLLILAVLLTSLPAASAPADAAVRADAMAPVDAFALSAYRGVITYRMRGPAAAPYGIGSSLMVGAAVPVAIARIQNVLRNLLELAGKVPAAQSEPAFQTVQRWMNEGIPVNLAGDLPVAGAYEATITFALAESGDGTFELQSGRVQWRSSNAMHVSDGEITLTDDFAGSGTYTLDPATDRISLRVDRSGAETMGELEVEITHPEPVDGSSEWSGPEGTFQITMRASGGEMVLDGSALGIPLSAAGAPTPMTVVEAPGPERSISYQRRAPMDEMNYNVEMWGDAFDDQVVVEYELSGPCTSRITAPEPDAVLAYKDGDPAVLEFTVEAKTDPYGLAPLLDELVWTFPEIPGSTLTTDPEDGRGRSVTVRYEGLPAKNTDFGDKRIEAHLGSAGKCEDPAPLPVRVFFARAASNNPDGETPNWFYYWKQTRASQGHGAAIVYDAATEDLGYFNGYGYPDKADVIHMGDLGPSFSDVNTVTGKRTRGIDLFASVVLHEWTHLENYHDWWPEGYDPAQDADADLVRDDREAAYGLDPNVRDTFGLGMRDCEIPAYLQENTWPSGSANSVDWANPGKQSGGGS